MPPSSALEIRDLRKTYPNGNAAVRGIDLDVAEGDFFALLGPNGAGKSTTIGIVASLVNKTGGTVRVLGHDLDSEPAAVKRTIGLVPQEFNFNVFEPIGEIVVHQAGFYGIPRRMAWARTQEYLERLGLWDRRKEMARNLSGGLKRRLLIARALVHEPRLLILDEPTAGVDIELRHSMWEFLREINRRGTTIILTTHYLEEAERLCRNIAIIDHGTIVENTNMRALLATLDHETFVLDLAAPAQTLPELADHTLSLIDADTLEAVVPKRTGLNELFAALDRRGIRVLSLRNKTNRLEQLFLHRLDAGRSAGSRDKAA
ncbi:MAG: ABC transporter ATP-binding protein [Chromatiales bacterium]|nr:ABC transporter ATP-binding protein [Chromatiales bacterium]